MEDEKKYETLYEKLMDYSKSDYYPFHMPGHKRNCTDLGEEGMPPYLYDITEIDGFDNLHHPEEIIKKRLNVVSEFYHSKQSFYLVNGSTCGIMSAISAATEIKKTILMARNSHKSSYNTAFLLNLKSEYIYPFYDREYGINGGINPREIEKLIQQSNDLKEIGAVFITSPTYEGVVSDIRAIADIAHKYDIPLIVDEAHGAHFGMHSYFPESALNQGADIVIQSLHKTLPSLTQTAILHVNFNSLISEMAIKKYLSIYQSSSPSYVLMESVDRCLDKLIHNKKVLFDNYVEKLDLFREKCKNLRYFTLWNGKNHEYAFDYDKSKLVIIPDKNYYDGKKLYDKLLRKYHLQMEMASERYVIGMTSVNDTSDGFERLYNALLDLEREIRISIRYREIYAEGKYSEYRERNHNELLPDAEKAVVCKKIRDASFEKYDMIELKMAKGKISQEFIYLYPPGVPLLAPGEIITDNIIKKVDKYLSMGLQVQGMEDKSCKMIKVVQENWSPIQFV